MPFGGDDWSIIKASGITTHKSKWIWLPVFCYLIDCIASFATHDTDVKPHVVEL